jgi:amphi-Trp domain-containing protein
MQEETQFKSDSELSRMKIAIALRKAADHIEFGEVRFESEDGDLRIPVPERSQFEVELASLTDSETGEQRYDLEYEIKWST